MVGILADHRGCYEGFGYRILPQRAEEDEVSLHSLLLGLSAVE
jgi:hypothetical protein